MRYASSAPPTRISGSAIRISAPMAAVNLLAVRGGALVSDLIGMSSMVFPLHPCALPAGAGWGDLMSLQHQVLQVLSLCPRPSSLGAYVNGLWIYVFNIVKVKMAVAFAGERIEAVLALQACATIAYQRMPHQTRTHLAGPGEQQVH